MAGWVSGAIVAGSVVSSTMSSRASSKATAAASEASAEQLAFAKQQYQDWQDTYGNIQSNLSEYYNNLTPEYYATQGLQAFQTEHQAAMRQVEQNLAQRGLSDSALAAGIESQAELDAAESKAAIRAGAEQQVLNAQSNFLSIGMGGGSAATGAINQALSQRASSAQQYATSAQQAAAASWGSTVQTIGQQAADYLHANPITAGSTTAALPANSGIYTNTPR